MIDSDSQVDGHMLDHALTYARLGWRIFRLTGYKTPFKGSHGFKDATVDANVIISWWETRPDANIGLATGFDEGGGPYIIVVDCDGESALAEFKAVFGGVIPRTLCARTAHGMHFYFLAPSGIRIKSLNAKREASGDPGIDVKADKAYVVLPPSVNAKNGFVYQWLNWGTPIAEADDRLLGWHAGRRRAGPLPTMGRPLAGSSNGGLHDLSPGSEVLGNNAASSLLHADSRKSRLAERALAVMKRGELPDFVAALRKIDAACGYDEWFRIGAAIYNFDPGGDGLAIFKRWSATAEKYREAIDNGACDAKWAEYEKGYDGQRVTVATVYALAREAGDSHDGYQHSEHKTGPAFPASRQEAPAHLNGHAHLPTVFQTPAATANKITLSELNEKFSTIGDVGGKCLVMGWVTSKVDKSLRVPSLQSCKSFSERYQHEYVNVAGDNKAIGAYWLKWPGKTYYEGLDLEPEAPQVLEGNVLNLWQGFAVEPVHGAWKAMQSHIRDVLAGGDEAAAEYITKFAAWAVQHPGERAEAALVFRGGKGTGKGSFANALRRLFGQHGLQIFNSKHLVGAFNGHLRNCLLLFADEAFWAGDKQGESVLKGMLTEPALMIEQKGVDAAPWKNRLHVIMSANAEWVVPASHDERRYTVLDVSDCRRDDQQYFKVLHDEIDNGGLEAMLYDLQRVELGDWHPRKILKTEALRQQKIRSMAPIDEWWENVLQVGLWPIAPVAGRDSTLVVPAASLLHIARDNHPRLNQLSAQQFGRFLKREGCEGYHRRDGESWEFPTLKQARQLFERRYGPWKWENDYVDWRKHGQEITHNPSHPSQ